ncbi:spore coat protein U domain-containing protein [Syntrophotalea carbinolica]|nr:spore coat protein U domain-containing protein [Syntrophotalea carbinolica]
MALRRVLIFMILVLAVAVPGHAASSGNLAVSAYITSWGACWVSGTEDIAFGALDPLDPQNVQATGSVNVTCFGFSSNFTVGVTQLTPSPLYLENGANSIPYTLDLPTSGSGVVGFFGAVSVPVTAHIQGSDYRFAPAGSYVDTVRVEINP